MQNRDKQIEEKQKVISDICPFYKEYGTCEQCNTELDIDDAPCYWECMAKAIIMNGYRKSTDLAEEIFAEIEEIRLKQIKKSEFFRNGSTEEMERKFYEGAEWGLRQLSHWIAELKKKYTKSEDTE